MKKYEVNTEIIARFMAENNLSTSTFCQLCHITTISFKKFLGSTKLSAKNITAFKIAAIMNVSVFDLFKEVQ